MSPFACAAGCRLGLKRCAARWATHLCERPEYEPTLRQLDAAGHDAAAHAQADELGELPWPPNWVTPRPRLDGAKPATLEQLGQLTALQLAEIRECPHRAEHYRCGCGPVDICLRGHWGQQAIMSGHCATCHLEAWAR